MSKKNKNKAKSNGKKASPAQYAANRQNAQLSTGPKTAETKAISAKNSLKHGLASQKFSLLDWEDPEVYEFFKASTLKRWSPQTEEEAFWVVQVIQNAWRLQRAIELETQALQNQTAGEDTARLLDRFRRYVVGFERSLEKAEQRLYDLRGLENPFAPKPPKREPTPAKPPEDPEAKLKEAERKALKAFLDEEMKITLNTNLPLDIEAVEARWQKFKPEGSTISAIQPRKNGFVPQ